MNVITKTVQLPDGRAITIETGKVAKQADGSAVLKMGNTVLLATVCAAKEAVPGTDFMPLQVDYREQYAAAGRFPGGFTKREGKPSDNEILTSRLVDRALRPLFPSDYHTEVYVQIMLLSADGVDQPDALAGFAASCAMACSDIPFECPISECRVARVNGEYVINPTTEQMKEADMDLMVGATKDNIMMVEGEMDEVSEQDLIGALKAAHEAIKPMCELQEELMKELGTDTKREYDDEINDEELRQQIKDELYQPAYDLVKQALPKKEREESFKQLITDFLEKYDAAHSDLSDEDLEEKHAEAERYYADVERDAMRRCVLDEGIRLDGRKTTDIRPIWCEVSPLPMPHGSAIFTRGETQSLSTCTLGTKLDEKLVADVLDKSYQRFLLHYNFPPFCTGEAKAQRGVGRREIGHGHLAWRGLKGQIPEDFPYTVRLVSQILESNGSSSMATVCAGTLALMDAGVPMKKPVSGIAMGLIQEEGKTVVLSDIQGLEDFLGDMDFKVTGTTEGITALQMDNKATGLTFDILARALQQAKEGRAFILQKMLDVIPEPRHTTRSTAPRIVSIQVPTDKIRDVIGSGGKVIRGIQDETGASVDIQEDGTVFVGGTGESVDQAVERIKLIIKVPEPGEEYTGRVVSIQPFGAFVNLLPGKDGLLHISRVAKGRVEKVEDVLNVGDEVKVVVIEVDDRGKISLDRLDKPEAPARAEGASEGDGEHFQRRERPRRERSERSDRPRRPGDNGGRKPRRHHDAE